MKEHELTFRSVLPRHSYNILRLDGKAFHTYLKAAEKPFDTQFIRDMAWLTERLCKEISGTTYAYTQSDEISILLQDVRPQSEPWFGGQVQKIVSVAAGIASSLLSLKRIVISSEEVKPVVFDARVLSLSNLSEVNDYFMWRQRDCIRNAIMMAAQAAFSHKELQGISSQDLIAKLAGKGIDFLEYPANARMGQLITKQYGIKEVKYTDKRTNEELITEVERSWWEAQAAPEFSNNWNSFILSNTPISLTEMENVND